MTFWRRLGFAAGRYVGRFAAGLGIRAWRDWMSGGKGKDEPPAPPTLPPAAVVLLVLLLGGGCAIGRELGIGFGQGVVSGASDCLRDPDGCTPPRRTPASSATPTPTPEAR